MIRVTQPHANFKHWMEKDDPRIGWIAQPYIIISDDFPGSIIDTAKLYEEDIVFAIKSVLFLLFLASNISECCERNNIRGFEICKTFYGFFYLLSSLLQRVVKYRWQN